MSKQNSLESINQENQFFNIVNVRKNRNNKIKHIPYAKKDLNTISSHNDIINKNGVNDFIYKKNKIEMKTHYKFYKKKNNSNENLMKNDKNDIIIFSNKDNELFDSIKNNENISSEKNEIIPYNNKKYNEINELKNKPNSFIELNNFNF